MRIVLALVVLALLASPAAAQPAARAFTVVDGLGVDEQTANKLIDLVARYDSELEKLQRQRSELRRRLVTARHDDAKVVNRLLDDSLANQRAVIQAEERLITRVRQIVSARQTAQLMVLLAATEPSHGEDIVPAETADRSGRVSGSYDPNSLFPPGSASRRPCDPFASMHGCRY